MKVDTVMTFKLMKLRDQQDKSILFRKDLTLDEIKNIDFV